MVHAAARRWSTVCLGLAASFSAVAPAMAEYPDRPVHLAVPYPPGGLGDTSARLVADSLAAQWNQAVIVDNKPGASTIIATQEATNAAKDGQTLYLCNTQNAYNEVLFRKVPYKLSDLTPVSMVVRFPFALLTTSALPVTDVAGLISYAQSNPGKLNFATFGPSSSSNFLASAFAEKYGLKIVTVPYKGTSQVMPDLISGAVQVFFDALGPSLGLYKDKKLKVLGVNASERLSVAPEVPTMEEQGYPFNFQAWFGICTTAGTPTPVVTKISEGVKKAVASDLFQKRMRDAGAIPTSSASPDEFSKFMRDEIDRWGAVIKKLDVHLD
jgi:tripartite-type tricarboxylate transporter receptor subunit TctC